MSDDASAAEEGTLERLLRASLSPPVEACPAETRLLLGPKGEGQAVARHVLDCPRCGALIDALAATDRALPSDAAGLASLRRAKALVRPEAPGLVRIVVRALGEALSVVHEGSLLRAAVPARGGETSDLSEPRESPLGVVITALIDDRQVRAHLNYRLTVGFELLIDVPRGVAGTGDLRVTLVRRARELRSEVHHGHPLMFSELEPARYQLLLREGGRTLGGLDLDLGLA